MEGLKTSVVKLKQICASLQENVTKLSIASEANSVERSELLRITFVQEVNPLIRRFARVN
jgi:hypothetical protein